MSSITFFLVFIPLLAFILLAVNLIFASHNSYPEKDSPFECGFHSFIYQNRREFSISFFVFALLFLLFDLEILLVFPYVVSAYTNSMYGLTLMLIFFLVLTLGFAFELGKGALKISSRQNNLDTKTNEALIYINNNNNPYTNIKDNWWKIRNGASTNSNKDSRKKADSNWWKVPVYTLYCGKEK
jgi:NADH-ubiquinone oxidoreductase chain 3